MDYNISSEKLKHPLLKKLLEEITPVFNKEKVRFFIIGATAKDIMMELHGEESPRMTKDIDIAIAIEKWEEFKNIEKQLVNLSSFKKDIQQEQRFTYLDSFQVDIVPYGGIMNFEDKIFWPPDESFAMSVLGFKEIEKDLVKIKIDNQLEIEIASLLGVFILKLVAWRDRHNQSNKDAEDLWFILCNYLSINEQRAVENYEDVYELPDFTTTKGGAAQLGIDINLILEDNKESKKKIKAIIETEVNLEERSQLFNQIIETTVHAKYEEVLGCFYILNQKIK